MISSEELRAAFEAVPDALVIVDGDAVIRDANRALLAVVDRGRDALVGEPLDSIITDEQIVDDLHEAIAAGGPMETLLRVGEPAAGAGEAPRTFRLTLSPHFTPDRHLINLHDVRAEQAAEAQLRLHAAMLDSVGESVIATDLDFRLIYWGKGAEEIYGYTEEEVLGRTPELAVAEAELPAQEARLAAALAYGIWRGETLQRRRDGTLFPALTTITLVRDESNTPIGVISIDREISDQKEATGLLEQREATLRAVSFAAEQFLRGGNWQEAIGEVLARLGEATDVSRVYIFQNHKASDGRLLTSLRVQWTAPDVKSQIAMDALQNLDVAELGFDRWIPTMLEGLPVEIVVAEQPEPAQSLLAAHGIQSSVIVPIFVDGEWWGFIGFDECRFERAWPSALVGALETAAGIMGAAITRERAEARVRSAVESARARSRHLKHVMDAMPAGVILLDGERRVQLANALGRRYLEALPVTADGVLRELGGQPLTQAPQEEGRNLPWREVRSDVGDRIYAVAEREAPAPGTGSGRVLVIRDVTEERERRRFLETQTRLATVGQLATGIAHDFNNILSVITLHSELAELNPDRERLGGYLQTIRRQAQNAAQLINQILDFSRRGVMEPGRLNLVAFLNENVQILRRTLSDAVKIETQVRPASLTVEADPARMQQVLMNLAVNARDAMPEGGTLSIVLDELTLAPWAAAPLPTLRPGRWACLEVSDTGHGIEPQQQQHIFEPFFTTKEAGEGTGLGLAQVYGIVRQHGGQIACESRPGQGTTFSVYLPVLGEQAVEEAPAEKALPPSGSERVLLVEDDASTREALAGVLEVFGYRVATAADGAQGLETFQARPEAFDVLITDIAMPRLSGADLARAALARRPNLCVIVLTGYALTEEERAGLKAANVATLQKPFTVQELVGAIQELMGAEG